MKNIYWLIQQLESIGGTEMVSTQIMNGLSSSKKINLVCMGERVENSPYQISDNVNIIYLNIKKKYIRSDVYFQDLLNRHKYLKLIIDLFAVAFFWLFGRFHFRKVIKRMTTKDDLIIASSLDNYALSPRGRKVIFHFHFNAQFFFSLTSRLGFLICRKPDFWVFLTKTTLDQVINRKPSLKNKADYVYNPTRYSRNLDTTYKNNNLIFIGRYVSQKRPLLAIEMANELNKLNPNFTFNFFGDGPLKNKMIELVNKYNLNDKVLINNSNPKIINEIHKSDLLVMTSEYEGFGLVILESNSQSVPTVSLYWGDATNEIIHDDVNGYIINNDDIVKQAQTINELLTNKEKLATLKASSYEYAANFTIEKIIDKWLTIDNK
jgi:glycosyltransferase involved in cell wall biosynthesis